jgi:two-component system chemotaxis response regulator CheY
MDSEISILIVDDFIDMRKMIKDILRKNGYKNAVEAEDGVAALKILKSERIDFIICDWNMPNMTGLDLLKEVRKDASLSRTPFLMLTAEAYQDSVIAAVEAGVDNYIVKPFTPAVLNDKMNKIFKK